MDGEITRGSGFAEEFENGVAESRVCQVWAAAMATERCEDSGLARIIFGIEAKDFTGIH